MDRDSIIKIVLVVLVTVAAVVVFVGSLWLHLSRAKAILRAWAAEAGVEIVGFRKTNWTGRGPFKWGTTGRNQSIYHLRVRDSAGRERSCWVRCGSYFGGTLLSNKTEVIWE